MRGRTVGREAVNAPSRSGPPKDAAWRAQRLLADKAIRAEVLRIEAQHKSIGVVEMERLSRAEARAYNDVTVARLQPEVLKKLKEEEDKDAAKEDWVE